MAELTNKDLSYSPAYAGNIFWIYPWIGMWHDLYILILNILFKHDYQKSQEEMNAYFPTKNTFWVNSGRAAILWTLNNLKLSKGDEVVISTLNCPAVIDPIIQAGAKPTLIDCNPNFGMNLNELSKSINNKTKAIILTNLYGLLDNRVKVRKIVGKKKITIINDLAQSLIVPGLHPEFFNSEDVYIFSFGQEKHLFGLGGGAVYTQNKRLSELFNQSQPKISVNGTQLYQIAKNRIKYFLTLWVHAHFRPLVSFLESKNLILKFDTIKSVTTPTRPEEISIEAMNPLQMHILAKKLKEAVNIERANQDNYNLLRTTIHNVWNITVPEGRIINPLYFTVIVDGNRNETSKRLADSTIPTVWNYIPLHLLERYKEYARRRFHNADRLWKKTLSLPFRYPMTNSKIDFVITKLTNL